MRGLEDIRRRPVFCDALIVDDVNDRLDAAIFVFPRSRSMYPTLLVEEQSWRSSLGSVV